MSHALAKLDPLKTGDTWHQSCTWRDDVGNPRPIVDTVILASLELKGRHLAVEVEMIDATQGQFLLKLTKEQTAGMQTGEWLGDISYETDGFRRSSNTFVLPVVKGIANAHGV